MLLKRCWGPSELALRFDGVDDGGLSAPIEERAAAGLEPEITESVILKDVRHIIASLQAIPQHRGITHIAIDSWQLLPNAPLRDANHGVAGALT